MKKEEQEKQMMKSMTKRNPIRKNRTEKFGTDEPKAMRHDRKFLNMMKNRYVRSFSNEQLKELSDKDSHICYIEMKRRENKKARKGAK